MLSIVKGPYLQMPTRDGITILWETSLEASTTVTIHSTGFSPDQSRAL
jgi:hypothetical protein